MTGPGQLCVASFREQPLQQKTASVQTQTTRQRGFVGAPQAWHAMAASLSATLRARSSRFAPPTRWTRAPKLTSSQGSATAFSRMTLTHGFASSPKVWLVTLHWQRPGSTAGWPSSRATSCFASPCFASSTRSMCASKATETSASTVPSSTAMKTKDVVRLLCQVRSALKPPS